MDVADQPLYALCKTIQMTLPGYGFDRYFTFMGGLHKEQVSLKIHGQMICGMGAEEILEIADLSINAPGNLVVNVPRITGARYVMEVRI